MGTLRALIEHASDIAETLFEPDDCLMPHFVAEARDGSITLVAMALGARELESMRALAQVKFQLDGYRRWVFFSEAWLAECEPGPSAVPPSENPRRMEAIQFDAFDLPGRRRRYASRQIMQVHGAPRRLMPLVFIELPVVVVPTVTAEA